MLAPYKYIYFDEDSGRIYGTVLYNVADRTASAFYNDKPKGDYVSLEKCQTAIENLHAEEVNNVT